MILLADKGNGRVTRDDNSFMPKVYKELLNTGKFYFQNDTNSIPPDVDLVFLGMFHDLLSEVNLPVIIDSSDTECFIKSKKVKRLLELGLVKKVITKLPTPVLYKYLSQYNIDKDKIFYIPWGIEPQENIYHKDIDVAFLCTISKDWKFHTTREKIYGILQNMQRQSFYNIIIGSAFDSLYKEILGRSKIFIVEGSNRVSLTYKYLEGANAGCLLIGDVPVIPVCAHSLFKDCMIEVQDWNQLPEIIKANINKKDKQIKCQQMIRENFDFNKAVEMYKNVLL